MFRNGGFFFRKAVVYIGIMHFTCIPANSLVGGEVFSIFSIDKFVPENEPSVSKHVEDIKNEKLKY
jgi:hypothetical protein